MKKVFFYSLAVFLIIFGTNSSFGSENNDLIPVPGDLNGDGVVDVADYQEFRMTLGKCEEDSGFNTEADYDFDGCVSYRDYRIWYDLYLEYGYQGPPAPVPATGQTNYYREGDDGDLQVGVQLPDPRFTDNGDGTVKDHLTGLIWLKNGNCFGTKTWNDAIDASNDLAHGQCGLSDGSSPGDWHLPNIRELHSLIDYGDFAGVLPPGHPFFNLALDKFYWSSTTAPGWQYYAMRMYWGNSVRGELDKVEKSRTGIALPVRGNND